MLITEKQPWPQSHHELIEHYYAQYEAQIASGDFQPYLYPWGTLGALGMIAYLSISHRNRPWLKKCRFLAFAWMTGVAIYVIFYTRARGVAPALGIGLVNAWGIIWAGAILLCNDVQEDFARIERSHGVPGDANAPLSGQDDDRVNSSKSRDTFVWQPFPHSPFMTRLNWVCDVFCNFRGAGWNWRISTIPPPPKGVQEQLIENSGDFVPKHSFRLHSGQTVAYDTRKQLLIANAKSLAIGYLVLDGLKTVMMHDPYFWGIMHRPPPDYLPFFMSRDPILSIYRMFLCMLGIKYALQTIFACAPLICSGLLGPGLLGARAEPWIFPETWSSYSTVLDRGLAGWWSCWWHQTFRFAFQQPSKRMIEAFDLDKRTFPAMMLQLVVAFTLSGLLHASGSHTAVGQTEPSSNILLFFLLQPLGIGAEVLIAHMLASTKIQRRVPKWISQAVTLTYVHVWFYYTAHLACDDFSQSGVWLFEPVPLSLFRGLGLGVDKRDGWWCWSGQIVRWHQGDRWWSTGLAF